MRKAIHRGTATQRRRRGFVRGFFFPSLCSLCVAVPLWFVFFGAMAVRPAAAAAAKPVVSALGNGATLITLYEPDASLVAFDIFFRVGYAEERQAGAAEGIVPLLSRAWISSVEGRSAGRLARDIGAVGGSFGTAFGGDYVELYAVVPATRESVGNAAQTLVMNIIGRPEFSAEAVEEAKREQLRAIGLENDQIFNNTMSRLRARLWDASPYTRSPLGSESSVRALSPDTVKAFYSRYFRPDRAVIVVAGNIRPEDARRLIEANSNAAAWGEGGKSSPVAPIAAEVLPRTPSDVQVSRRTRITFMMAGFLVPGTRERQDYPALLLLEALVGSGKGSRLFRNLRDARGIGYEVGAVLQPGMYQGLLAGYVATATYRMGPAGPQPILEEVRKGLLGEMKSVLATPPDAEELARAKALVKGRYALRHERLKDRAWLLGWSEVMGLGADLDASFDARIDAVTPDQVQRLARRVLGANHVLALTLPEQ